MRTVLDRWVVVGLLLAGTCGRVPAAEAGDTVPWVITRRTLPGGAPGGSVIDLEQSLPREVRQGEPFDYRLRVANCADCPVAEVAVVQRLPAGVRLLASHPQAEVQDGVATWRLGTLAIRDSRLIQARAVTDDVGAMTFCCDTLYRAPLCVTVPSVRPELLLGLDVPAEATPCEGLPLRISVRNTGTGACRDVRLQYDLPEGMAGPDARRAYLFQVGTLPAGEVRSAQLQVRPLRTGVFEHHVMGVAADGLRADASAETRIVAPVLAVTLTGTDQQFAGRDVVYSFAVRNDGDAPARNVLVEDALPTGVQVVAMRPETAYAAGNERVVWRLQELPVGASARFSLTVRSDAAAALANQVTARADCAQAAAASYASQVNGVAAVLLEVVDQDDPIEVGGRDTYVITITNQGTAPCTRLVVKCLLEDYVKYLSSEGPSAGTASGQEVAFAPLPVLMPKAVAVWKVTCEALRAGDARFRVLLTSDQLTRPVEETESTHLY